jgi:long-subunit fatty acid transport protein
VGVAITDWLSVGLGVRFLMNLQIYTTGLVSDVTTTTDPDTGESMFSADTRLGEDALVFGRAAPTLGLAVRPLDALSLGFTYRHELFVDDWGYARTTSAPGLGALGYAYRFAHYYQPHEFVLAAAWTPVPELRVSLDLTLSLWSNALSKNADPLPGRFGDTLTPALGVRYEATPGVGILAGYRFVPRRFDNFGGPTNMLDTDEHTGSLGADVDLAKVTGDDIPIVVRAAGRVSVLPEREEQKDFRRFESDSLWLANPGYPGYRYGGAVLSGQLEVETRF